MRKSGAFPRLALILAGACMPVAWLGLSAGMAYGEDAHPQAAQDQAAATPTVDTPLHGIASNFCEKCHNTTDWAGSLAMDSLDLSHTDQDPEVWEKAITKLRGRLMPPAGEKQPDQAEIDAVIHYLETSLDAAAKEQVAATSRACRPCPDPAPQPHRVRGQSVKDLIGVEVDPKQVLPTEIEVEGFSNISGALGISPTFMEQYLSAARHVAQRAIGEPIPKTETVFYGGGGGGGGQAGLGLSHAAHP